MSLFLLVLVLMGAYFLVAALGGVAFVACWLYVQDRRKAAMLDRAAVAAEWTADELVELVDEFWTERRTHVG